MATIRSGLYISTFSVLIGNQQEGNTNSAVFNMGGLRFLACMAVLALALLPLATAPANQPSTADSVLISSPAEGSSGSSVTVGLEVARSGTVRPALTIRGNRTSASDTGPFRAETEVSRIPCPGEYRFEAAQEDARTGNSATYTALIELFDLSASPAAARCGIPPPPLAGRVSILVEAHGDETFVLHGKRRNGGRFKGELFFKEFLRCGRPYRLSADLDLVGLRREFDFKAHVIEVRAEFQGRKIPNQRC